MKSNKLADSPVGGVPGNGAFIPTLMPIAKSSRLAASLRSFSLTRCSARRRFVFCGRSSSSSVREAEAEDRSAARRVGVFPSSPCQREGRRVSSGRRSELRQRIKLAHSLINDRFTPTAAIAITIEIKIDRNFLRRTVLSRSSEFNLAPHLFTFLEFRANHNSETITQTHFV